jgi:hypothetical protein
LGIAQHPKVDATQPMMAVMSGMSCLLGRQELPRCVPFVRVSRRFAFHP